MRLNIGELVTVRTVNGGAVTGAVVEEGYDLIITVEGATPGHTYDMRIDRARILSITVGDPLADVGLLAVYHRLAAVSDGVMPAMSPANGFLSADQMAARYAEKAGRDLSQLDWYIAFGYYKLAVISEGIHYRYLQGKTVGEGFSQMGDRVPQLLDAALGLLADR